MPLLRSRLTPICVAAILALLTVLQTACNSTPPDLRGDAPIIQTFASPEYGVQVFTWWQGEEETAETMRKVDEMGFGWVKQHFAWRDIETIEKGKFDWYFPDVIVSQAEARGLKLLVRLDRQPFWSQPAGTPPTENVPPENLADFGDYCSAVAARYRGRIAAYQVWNEPNLSREWGHQTPDPAAYTALLAVCHDAIKAADPAAIVISAGLAPTGTQPPEAMPAPDFLQGMYAAGAAPYFDVLGANAPGYKAPPETAPAEAADNEAFGRGRWFAFRHVEDQRQIMLDNGDGAKQVAILEMGWTTDPVNPSYAWHAVSEAEQADYLVRAYAFAAMEWAPWIGLMTTLSIADRYWTADNEQYWWAITLPDGTPRPAYAALRDMPK